MARLFWGNYAFEDELAGRQRNSPLQYRLQAELACCWMPVADEGDLIWCPRPASPAYFERLAGSGIPAVRPVSDANGLPTDLEFTPWGWSHAARSFASRIGATADAPSHAVVRRANSRRFSLEHEIRWGLAPQGVTAIESLAELEQLLRKTVPPPQRWVLKAEFSYAARERLLARGPELSWNQAQWTAKRLRRDGVVFFEPWFERIAEAGLQWTVPRQGRPILAGITRLLTDSLGQYRGSSFGKDELDPTQWHSVVEMSERMACELKRIGYFGPVGIDALRFRDANGVECVRPLQDVNARWTMGRLSLGWRRIADAGTWWHGTRQQLQRALSENPWQCLSTSPESIDHRLVQHATWLEIDP